MEEAMRQEKVTLLAHRSDMCIQGSVVETPRASVSTLDSEFALDCQEVVAHEFKGNLSVTLVQANGEVFLRTKPTLKADTGTGSVNVTMLMHQEQTPPFNHSLA